ncbi:M1 family aminopeptidase, partial [Brevundimonas bullata]|uniref:M1 family aminopeptidase n=1 Tax=Brevundimonas bullata TaxID=13160 RepID=UPI002FD95FF6
EQPLVMAMSFYPPEASPLWDRYSTPAVAHAVKVYGAFAFPYPYPVAQAVFGPVDGMEYPMLMINDPLPTPGPAGRPPVVTQTAINTLVEVHIHEIGHFWFPMIVNSDERQWSWLDEGLNSFVQYQAEKQWRADFPSRFGGPPRDIAAVLAQRDLQPIMTHPDSQRRYFSTTYTRPATALNVLRETVLGPERFDRAFREYSDRWRFKRATPTDFFRTMEEASGVDLDWFWRAWFYSDDHVDVALDDLIKLEAPDDLLVYQLTFRNVGGMVTPLSLRVDFEDGTHEAVNIPADVWRLNPSTARWRYVAQKPVVGARLDHDFTMADSDRTNNARTLGGSASDS